MPVGNGRSHLIVRLCVCLRVGGQVDNAGGKEGDGRALKTERELRKDNLRTTLTFSSREGAQEAATVARQYYGL